MRKKKNNALEEDSAHGSRNNSNQKTNTTVKKNPLEDDSGHFNKTPLVKRTLSIASNSSFDDSDTEFASEDKEAVGKMLTPPKKTVTKKINRLPPKLPPSTTSPTRSSTTTSSPTTTTTTTTSSKPKKGKRSQYRKKSFSKTSTTAESSNSTLCLEEESSTSRGSEEVDIEDEVVSLQKSPRKKSATKSKTRKKKSATTTTIIPTIKGCLLKDDSKRSARPKQVRFGRLVITEFGIILGDNPAVTSGAPVTIDWAPQDERSYTLNAYEQSKPKRRRRRKLLISVSNRAILLLAAGYSINEIADASINAQEIKFGRQESYHNQQWDRVNVFMESTNNVVTGVNGAVAGIMQNTGKKLKSLIVKPMQHSESARTA
jgi:hypothetical protein